VHACQAPLRRLHQLPGARQLALGVTVALEPDARALAHAIEHRAGVGAMDAQLLAAVADDIREEALVAAHQPARFKRRGKAHQPCRRCRPWAMRSTAASRREMSWV